MTLKESLEDDIFSRGFKRRLRDLRGKPLEPFFVSAEKKKKEPPIYPLPANDR